MPNRPVVSVHALASEWPERIILWGVIAGLAWTPAYLGGNAVIVWGANAVLFGALAMAYEISIVVRRRSHPVGVAKVAVPTALFLLVVLWIVLQTATWAPGALQHPIWSMAADVLGRPVAGSISVDRDLTALSLLGLITSACVFWLAMQLCRNAERAEKLLTAIAVTGVFYALYGLAAFVISPGYTLWYENPEANGFLTSTFYNKNTYGTYAGIVLCTLVGLSLSYYRRRAAEAGVSFKYRLAVLLDVTGGGGTVLLAAIFVTLVSLLLTASRGAIVSTAFGLIVISALGSRSKRRGREQRLTVIIGALLLASIFVGFGDEFLGRVESNGVVDAQRLAVANVTISSTLHSPALGYGYGTFGAIFPMFRDRSIGIFNRWLMAHNSYLEVFQGLGLVFGAMLIGSVSILAARCLKGATTRYTTLTPSRVAAGVSLLVGLHALVDFSLQIQGVALIFAAILGAGVAQSESSRADISD
jgi:hypothetical protein